MSKYKKKVFFKNAFVHVLVNMFITLLAVLMSLLLPQKYPKTVTAHKCSPSNNFLKFENNLQYIKRNYKHLKGLKPALWLHYDNNCKYYNNEYDRLPYKYCDDNNDKLFIHFNDAPLNHKINTQLKKQFKCPFLKCHHKKYIGKITSNYYDQILNRNKHNTKNRCNEHISHIHCCFCDNIYLSNGNK